MDQGAMYQGLKGLVHALDGRDRRNVLKEQRWLFQKKGMEVGKAQ